MDIIQAGARGGKTTQLVAAWRQTRGYFVVSSHNERVRITRQFQLSADEANRIFVVGDRARIRQSDPAQPLYVDNADLILADLFGRMPHAITATTDEPDYAAMSSEDRMRERVNAHQVAMDSLRDRFSLIDRAKDHEDNG